MLDARYNKLCFNCFVFFNDTATTEIYTLSLHDALPILRSFAARSRPTSPADRHPNGPWSSDRKSTRLNSSHSQISYAVFCLKKYPPKNLCPCFQYLLGEFRKHNDHAVPQKKASWNVFAQVTIFFFFAMAAPPKTHLFPPTIPLDT